MFNFEDDRRTRSEQLVLSALLRDSRCACHIDTLCPSDFSHDLHGQIFRHVVKLMAMCQPVDAASVYESIMHTRGPRAVGTLAYLNALEQLGAIPAHAGYYACELRTAEPGRWFILSGDPEHGHDVPLPL
ncbi:DnaB-like helicase N-terminal domain-containing protein [Paraburkholderia dipogonis]|uniref:DnaB-like helicase N-terminal domain-containing protein n=1 Tax=Paraburkholderia dipogonis TaxID=1211383 RepID=UPI0038B7D3FE